MEQLHTLLAADWVDSTALNAQLGDKAMALLWEDHDRASRELAQRFDALEIDRTDGFLLLFDGVARAAAFATAYHRMLSEMPHRVRARVGVHVGELTLREASAEARALGARRFDAVGIAKAVTARLMGLADGGQTLASAAAIASLGDDASVQRVSHGFWRLKGLDEPLEVFEVGADDAPFVPPRDGEKAQQVALVQGQWVGLRDVPHRLPAERDAFFGRTELLRTIARRFNDDARLVLLQGPGGTGKTRLSQRYGWSWLGQYPGGVYFCDLSTASGVDGVLNAVARALDLPADKATVAALGQAIAARGRCLLVLDNFEQVARHADATLGRWLDAAGEARFLVTSREALGLPGESAIAVDGLPLDDAVALFHARAAALNPAHDPSTVAPATVHELARLLDGLPLALELAAARTTVLSPEQLLARMGDRLRLLAVRHGRPERQATLRAAIAWSWDLLDATERQALAQLSVFDGGFTLASAEAVLDLPDGPGAVLDAVQSLVSKSLVRREGDARFGMLRTIQHFADEQLSLLEQAAGRSGATARRHWLHFAGLDERVATATGCPELDNLVTACRRSAAAGDAAAAAGVLPLAWAALRLTGPLAAALPLAEAVGAMPAADDRVRATAHAIAAEVGFAMNDLERSRAQAGQALALLAADDDALAGRVHCTLGGIDSVTGHFEDADLHLQTARRTAERVGQAGLLCRVLSALGTLALDRGRLPEARDHYLQALALAQTAQLPQWQCGAAGNLGSVHYELGHLDEARVAFESSLALARATGNRRWQGNALCNLGVIHHDQGRPQEALVLLGEALEVARLIGQGALQHHVHCIRGLARDGLGDLPGACEDFSVAVAGADAAADLRSASQFRIRLGSAQSRRGLHDEALSCLARALDEAGRVGDPLTTARVLCTLAEVEARAGRLARAREVIEDALRVAQAAGLLDALAPDLERARRLSRG